MILPNDRELDEMKARCDAATKSPWEFWDHRDRAGVPSEHGVLTKGSCSNHVFSVDDDRFIAHARTDLPRCVEALREAMEFLEIFTDGRCFCKELVEPPCISCRARALLGEEAK